jgi:hypothetical protein
LSCKRASVGPWLMPSTKGVGVNCSFGALTLVWRKWAKAFLVKRICWTFAV